MKYIIIAATLIFPTSITLAAPPQGMKLSEIIAKIEQTADFHYIDEVEWEDSGYYDIEYYTTNGSKIEIKINPTNNETDK